MLPNVEMLLQIDTKRSTPAGQPGVSPARRPEVEGGRYLLPPFRSELSRRQFPGTSFASLYRSCVARCGPVRRERHHPPIDGSADPRSTEGHVAPQRLFPGSAGTDQFRDALSGCWRPMAAIRPQCQSWPDPFGPTSTGQPSRRGNSPAKSSIPGEVNLEKMGRRAAPKKTS